MNFASILLLLSLSYEIYATMLFTGASPIIRVVAPKRVECSPSAVVRVDLDTNTRVDSLILNSGEDSVGSFLVNGNDAYLGTRQC